MNSSSKNSKKGESKSDAKMSLRVERVVSPEQAAAGAGAHINDILTQYADQPVLFLIAGGSALNVLDHIKTSYLGENLTVTVTDDRFSEELDENNFAILQATHFYNELILVNAFCIDTQLNPGELFEEYRARFEQNIREWKRDFPDGVIVALYGMGPDGHTGGMIPGTLNEEQFEKEYNSDDRLVGAMDASQEHALKPSELDGKPYENLFPRRVSTTLPFMRHWVDHTVFYITGEKKSAVLREALAGKEAYFKLPATVMTHMKDVVVFTDIAE